jgi:tRNA A22 N-methylase
MMMMSFLYTTALSLFWRSYCSSIANRNSRLLVATVWSNSNYHKHLLRKASTNTKYYNLSTRTALFSSKSTVRTDIKSFTPEEEEDVFSTLAKTGKTKRRLSHFLDFPLDEESPLAIADIGCDHGILSFALAYSGRYSTVIGVDVSESALENGAAQNMKKLGLSPELPITNSRGLTTTVEFRQGDGLSALNDKEVQCVCIAGMGVDTMMKILFSRSHSSTESELERIGCKFVYLQPANPRPRHLTRLYDTLQMAGYALYQERIEELSNHWYITTAFVKQSFSEKNFALLPGSYLASQRQNAKIFQIYLNYCNHHRNWILSDVSSRYNLLSNEDARWLEHTANVLSGSQSTEKQ